MGREGPLEELRLPGPLEDLRLPGPLEDLRLPGPLEDERLGGPGPWQTGIILCIKFSNSLPIYTHIYIKLNKNHNNSYTSMVHNHNTMEIAIQNPHANVVWIWCLQFPPRRNQTWDLGRWKLRLPTLEYGTPSLPTWPKKRQ